MAETVVGGPLLRVLQAIIGFVDFLEAVFGFGVAGISVRMKLHRKLAICAFQFLVIGALANAQRLVEIGLHRRFVSQFSMLARLVVRGLFRKYAPSLLSQYVPKSIL